MESLKKPMKNSRVSIWDLDWYHKYNFVPNYKAQKVSSYYKQKGAFINFIEKESHINFEYDIMFIFREKKMTPMPPSKYIDVKNVKLVGDDFKYYDNQFNLTMEMDMVRPDYLLYDIPEGNAYANAHILKLMHERILLPARQDHINYHVKYSQKTLIVDQFIWDLEEKQLIKVLEEIIQYKNIAFSYPIKLKPIFSYRKVYELFNKLNFTANTVIEFQNNYSSTFDAAKKIIKLAQDIKGRNSRIKIKPIPFKAVIYNHWKDRTKGIKDLERILEIVDYSKKMQTEIVVKTPLRRLDTPFWYYFDTMEMWTTDFPHLSYIESMVSTRITRTGEKWNEVINDSKKWSTPRIYFLIHLLNSYPEIFFKKGLLKGKDEILDISLIDLNEVSKINTQTKDLQTFEELEKNFLEEVEK